MRVMYGFVGFFVAAPALVADEIGVGELAKNLAQVGKNFFPVPNSYVDGFFCVTILEAYGAVMLQGGANVGVDAACATVLRA